MLCLFLLSLCLFQIHAIRLSPRLWSPALPSLPADKITRGGRCQFIAKPSRPVSCLPQVYPPQGHCTCASVTLEVRKRGLLAMSLFLVWPAMTGFIFLCFCAKEFMYIFFSNLYSKATVFWCVLALKCRYTISAFF